jgi:hypothetical protein
MNELTDLDIDDRIMLKGNIDGYNGTLRRYGLMKQGVVALSL